MLRSAALSSAAVGHGKGRDYTGSEERKAVFVLMPCIHMASEYLHLVLCALGWAEDTTTQKPPEGGFGTGV